MAFKEHKTRDICDIARDIENYFNQLPYGVDQVLLAMHCLTTIDDFYMNTSAKQLLQEFLELTEEWHGSHARRIKNEIRRMLQMKEE